MLIIISPSKTQDFSYSREARLDSISIFMGETQKLAKVMVKKNTEELMKMMKVSSKIGELNKYRFREFDIDFDERRERGNGERDFKQAVFAFKGEVYRGFDFVNYHDVDFEYLNNHLRIISGFYGLLKPFDLIKPYRLEMGAPISFETEGVKYKNLYEFWKGKIGPFLKESLLEGEKIINLASIEYSKAIELEKFKDNLINIDFKVERKGELKIVAIYAKKQRGEMANWIIKNRVDGVDELETYENDGFVFNKKLSTEDRKVFVKKML